MPLDIFKVRRLSFSFVKHKEFHQNLKESLEITLILFIF